MIPRVLSLLAVSVLWLVGAVAAQPAAEWRVLLNKAVSLRDSGAPDAEAAFEEAAAKAKFLGDSGLAMAIVSNNLSVLLLRQGRYDTAEEKLTSAIRIYEQLADAPAVEVAAALHNLGFLKRQVGKREEEEAYFRLAVERMEKHKPVNAMVLVQMLGNLALHYVENGRLPAAVPLLESASRYETEAVVSQHPFRVPLLIASSEFHLQRGETQVAREKAALALRIVENAKWLRDLEIAGPLHQLARTEMEMGRLREAETHWKRSLDIIRARRSESYPQLATILIPLATIARQQGRDEECERLLHEAARVAEAGNRLSAVAVAQHQLALLHASRKRHRQAETLLRSSMALTTKEVGRENTQTVICMADLAATLAAQRKYAEAEVFLREAIGVVEKVRVASDSWLSQLLQRHAEVLRKLKRKDEAKAVASRAKALLESGLVAKPGQTVDVLELQPKRR